MNIRFEPLTRIKKLFTFPFSWWKYILSSLLIVAANPSNAIAQCDTTLARGDLWFANDESGSVSNAEFEDALDFIYQISDSFTYDDDTGMQAGIIGWTDSVNSQEIVMPISESFGDPGDSGLFGDNNISVNGNTEGVRELYTRRRNTSRGTRLDYAVNYLANLITAGNGSREKTPQVAIILTDANITELNAGGFPGLLRSLTAAANLQDSGTRVVMVLIEHAVTAYETDPNSKIIIDGIANGGRIIKVPRYTDAADPSLVYIKETAEAICELATPIPSDPGLLLAKRITAINPGKPDEIQFNGFIDDFGTTDDNDPLWPDYDEKINDSNLYLRGVIDGGGVRPGDEVEYTIYFLSNGDEAAEQVSICDVVPDHLTFVRDGYGQEIGIALGFDPTEIQLSPNKYLSNLLNDDEGDFYGPGTAPPANLCKKVDDNNNLVPVDGSNNDNGVIIVRPAVALPEDKQGLPPAVSPGEPRDSYGFIRFRARVK